jgi:hypothetical protein
LEFFWIGGAAQECGLVVERLYQLNGQEDAFGNFLSTHLYEKSNIAEAPRTIGEVRVLHFRLFLDRGEAGNVDYEISGALGYMGFLSKTFPHIYF